MLLACISRSTLIDFGVSPNLKVDFWFINLIQVSPIKLPPCLLDLFCWGSTKITAINQPSNESTGQIQTSLLVWNISQFMGASSWFETSTNFWDVIQSAFLKVAMSYLVTYGTTLASFFLVYLMLSRNPSFELRPFKTVVDCLAGWLSYSIGMTQFCLMPTPRIPNQKAEAQQRKQKWGSSTSCSAVHQKLCFFHQKTQTVQMFVWSIFGTRSKLLFLDQVYLELAKRCKKMQKDAKSYLSVFQMGQFELQAVGTRLWSLSVAPSQHLLLLFSGSAGFVPWFWGTEDPTDTI